MAIECEHGSLARSCLICELQERIRELERQLEDCAAQSSSRQGLIIQYEARIGHLERHLFEARVEISLRRNQMSRFPFCPDHRDKVHGLNCRECEIERVQRRLREVMYERDRALEGCAKLHEQYLGGAK